MANHARIRNALPPAVAEWLATVPESSPLWEEMGREVAIRAAQELLVSEGEAGLGLYGRQTVSRGWSHAARCVAEGLPSGRRWTANLVSPGVCGWFGVFSARDDVRRRIPRESFYTPVGEVPPTSQRPVMLH